MFYVLYEKGYEQGTSLCDNLNFKFEIAFRYSYIYIYIYAVILGKCGSVMAFLHFFALFRTFLHSESFIKISI